jgi:5'-phosphate synthase pdxT subunit
VGARAVPVRREAELGTIDALVLPGGESTAMWKLATAFDLLEPLRAAVRSGMPTYGSCAGMIMLADRLEDGMAGQETIGGMDVTVRRNAFGRQVDSFEADLPVPAWGEYPFRMVFIRAPWVEQVGSGVDVLAQIAGVGGLPPRIVAIRQGVLLATSFHPEVTADTRVHRYFIDQVCTRS